MIDYLDKPPQRYDPTCSRRTADRAKNGRGRQGEHGKFDEMYLYMFEGAQLMQQAMAEHKALTEALRKAETRLQKWPKFTGCCAAISGIGRNAC